MDRDQKIAAVLTLIQQDSTKLLTLLKLAIAKNIGNISDDDLNNICIALGIS